MDASEDAERGSVVHQVAVGNVSTVAWTLKEKDVHLCPNIIV
jgi:hypothetical protein